MTDRHELCSKILRKLNKPPKINWFLDNKNTISISSTIPNYYFNKNFFNNTKKNIIEKDKYIDVSKNNDEFIFINKKLEIFNPEKIEFNIIKAN